VRASRLETLRWALPLLATIFVADLGWALIAGSTESIAYGLVDEPAHLATCGLLLVALRWGLGRPLPIGFVAAALVASVAIDLDHLPGYLGWGLVIGELPRPYTHSAALAGVFCCIACVARRREVRDVLLGVSFGVAAHLARDLATGPGVPLAWPLSDTVVSLPYPFLGVSLLVCLLAVALPRGLTVARAGAPLAIAALAVGAWHSDSARAAPASAAIGIYLPGSDWEPHLIDRYAEAVGRRPALVSIYRDWSKPPFEPAFLDPIAARGAVPMVTWEPWHDWARAIPLRAISAGAQDQYIAAAADAAAAWGGPLFVRFAHEMNGGWYPWGRIPGNTPAAYKSMWRHVVAIFRQRGASNVRWVWTPYVEGDRQRPFRRFYPGDGWVDWAGLDGFNWGRRFVSFAKIFQRSYETLVGMTQKPLMIAETGSVEFGGSKPEWIRRSLNRALPRYKHVRALVWWDGVHPGKGTDVRLETSPESFSAWSEALRAGRLSRGRDFLLSTPGWIR
jgi:membrane-bound metal-dependent hydrolase YbcI (DUF457 family)